MLLAIVVTDKPQKQLKLNSTRKERAAAGALKKVSRKRD
jgi:hypothetical protein